jgi:hypothetical protein
VRERKGGKEGKGGVRGNEEGGKGQGRHCAGMKKGQEERIQDNIPASQYRRSNARHQDPSHHAKQREYRRRDKQTSPRTVYHLKAGWLRLDAGWMVGWLVGWLVCWLVGWCYYKPPMIHISSLSVLSLIPTVTTLNPCSPQSPR